MAHIVLVPGAMHGAWCWELVVPELRARGHEARAIDMPGLGDDATPAAQVTAEHWTQAVLDAVRRSVRPVVLIGHSLGGTAIAHAAERAPERLAGLVFVTAIMIGDGETIMTACPESMVIGAEVTREFPDDPRAVAMRLFYGRTDPALAEAAINRLRPQPEAVATAPMRLSAAGFGRVRRAYIECLEDDVVPLAVQRRMQAELTCEAVISLHSDHSPFLCASVELAEAIDRLARRFDPK